MFLVYWAAAYYVFLCVLTGMAVERATRDGRPGSDLLSLTAISAVLIMALPWTVACEVCDIYKGLGKDFMS